MADSYIYLMYLYLYMQFKKEKKFYRHKNKNTNYLSIIWTLCNIIICNENQIKNTKIKHIFLYDSDE